MDMDTKRTLVTNEIQYLSDNGFITRVNADGTALLEWDSAGGKRRVLMIKFPDVTEAEAFEGTPVSFVTRTHPPEQENIIVLTLGFMDTSIQMSIPVDVFINADLDPKGVTTDFENALEGGLVKPLKGTPDVFK